MLFAELSSPKIFPTHQWARLRVRDMSYPANSWVYLLYIHLHALWKNRYKTVKFRDSAKRRSIHTNLFKNTIMTKKKFAWAMKELGPDLFPALENSFSLDSEQGFEPGREGLSRSMTVTLGPTLKLVWLSARQLRRVVTRGLMRIP